MTTLECLQAMQEPYQSRPLANYDPAYSLEDEHTCISDALLEAFNWESTTEGLAYWEDYFWTLTLMGL